MTFQIGRIQGGTHAGWRKTRSVSTENWQCPGCGADLRYYWTKCPNCSHERPERD